MELKDLKNVECVWKPVGPKDTIYEQFLNLIRDKYHVKLDGYWDLHKWSVENIPDFWAEVWKFAEIKCSKNFEQVVDLSVTMSNGPKWFIGARLNIVENLLRYKDDKIALTAIGEDREKRVISYSELYEETKLYSAAFRKFGFQKGDRVACYMSNREEAILAMFGAVSIGAVWVGILPMLGAQAVINRVKQVSPRILVVGDRIRYNGQETDLLSKVSVIAKDLPTLEKIIIVPTMSDSLEKDIGDIPNSCFLSEFLSLGRNADGTVPDIIFEQVPFSHPFTINYTSGTTGLSKAIVHDYGFLLGTARDHIVRGSVRNTTILSVSPAGWATWIISLTNLFSGRHTVLYDGVPYFLSPTYFWDLIDEYEISNTFLTPGILDELEQKRYIPTKNHKLTSLNVLTCGASVVKPQNYDFVNEKIKRGLAFFSIYGSTEIMAPLMYMHYSLPIRKGEIPCLALGIEVECLNDAGESVVGKFGNLFITKPTPFLLSCVYGDTDRSTLKEKYFSKYSDKFDMGDLAAINPFTKGIIIHCRNDEVLNQYGCRFGSIEIYNALNDLPEIQDSLCVAQYSKNRNERVVLFLKVREGHKFNDELVKKVKETLESELTDEHIPGLILSVPEIPYNLNGKKMELLVKKIINRKPYNSDTVMNKDSLKYYEDIPPFLD